MDTRFGRGSSEDAEDPTTAERRYTSLGKRLIPNKPNYEQ